MVEREDYKDTPPVITDYNELWNGVTEFIEREDVIFFIDQLDEPEVLSQEWIDEHAWNNDHIWRRFVFVDDLKELLVPKQELPVIPKFVADFIESYDGDFYSLLYDADNISSDASLVTEEYYELGNWLSVNSDELLQAVANGYTVEEELLYRLKAGKNYLYFKNDGSVQTVTKKNATINKERLEKLPFDLEQALDSGIIELEELE